MEVVDSMDSIGSLDSLDDVDPNSSDTDSASSHLSAPDDFDVIVESPDVHEENPRASLPQIDVIPDNFYLAVRRASDANRPDNLPVRSRQDSREIDRKVMAMNQTIQRRLIENAIKTKGRRISRAERRRRKKLIRDMERQIAKSRNSEAVRAAALAKYHREREEFLRKSALVWRQRVLPRFDSLKTTRSVLRMWRRGLPPSVRGRVWKLAVGNALNITVDDFSELKSRALTEDLFRSTSEYEVDESVVNVSSLGPIGEEEEEEENQMSQVEEIEQMIALDLVRTFPSLKIFQSGGPYHESFLDVLYCWVKFYPQIGYVQGMSYLVAMLLLNMDSFSAFKLFANMVLSPSYHFSSMFVLNKALIDRFSSVLGILMKKKIPELYDRFIHLGISHDVFIIDWFITLFSRAFPLELATHFWDLFFVPVEGGGGVKMLYRTTLGIMLFYFPKLMKLSFEELMFFLSHMKGQVREEDRLEMLKAIALVKISDRLWRQAEEEADRRMEERGNDVVFS